MVKRYHPPVVNDEAERPEYMEMVEHSYGRFVEAEDYEMLKDNQSTLREMARRMMASIKNSCVDEVTTRLVDADDPKVVAALQELEKVLMEMNVDFSILSPRTER